MHGSKADRRQKPPKLPVMTHTPYRQVLPILHILCIHALPKLPPSIEVMKLLMYIVPGNFLLFLCSTGGAAYRQGHPTPDKDLRLPLLSCARHKAGETPFRDQTLRLLWSVQHTTVTLTRQNFCFLGASYGEHEVYVTCKPTSNPYTQKGHLPVQHKKWACTVHFG